MAASTALLLAGTSYADGDNKGIAEALFEKGRAAMAAADYATACASFSESNRLDPAPGTMANLAGCEEKRGHLSAAWQWYEEAAEKLPAGDPRRDIAEQRATEVKTRLPMLTVRLAPGAPAGTKVLRDGVDLGSIGIGTPLPADPGAHSIIVSAPGFADGTYSAELHEAEKSELVVAPGPALIANAVTAPPTSAAPVPATESAPASDNRTMGYVIGGVGVAGVGTALVLGGLALGKKSTVADHCDTSAHTCDSQAGIDAASAGRTLSTVSTVSFIVGAAALGVGTYFILTSHHGNPTTTLDATASLGGGFVSLDETF